MYRYIFFDLDGTLTRSEFGILEAAKRALAHFGIETPEDELMKRFIGPPLYVSFRDYYKMPEKDCLEAVRVYREYYEKEGVYMAPLFAGIKEMLAKLRDMGCRLMVVTSKVEHLAETVVSYEGIEEFFEGIVGPGPDGRDPDKSILIRRAMDRLNLTEADRNEIVMVGDRFYDIEAAVETGIDSIAVLYGYGSEEELRKAGATKFVKEPSEIPSAIAGNAGEAAGQ